MSCYTKEELENILEDVVNELDLSGGAIEKHGSLGTPPAELVRLVLEQKNKQIELLEAGFIDATRMGRWMMADMPDRIWAGDYVGIVGLPSPIWFDEKPGNNGDLARQTEYLRSTPERERVGEMRELLVAITRELERLESFTYLDADALRLGIAGIKTMPDIILGSITAEEEATDERQSTDPDAEGAGSCCKK